MADDKNAIILSILTDWLPHRPLFHISGLLELEIWTTEIRSFYKKYYDTWWKPSFYADYNIVFYKLLCRPENSWVCLMNQRGKIEHSKSYSALILANFDIQYFYPVNFELSP